MGDVLAGFKGASGIDASDNAPVGGTGRFISGAEESSPPHRLRSQGAQTGRDGKRGTQKAVGGGGDKGYCRVVESPLKK